jgi:hypothetical protein
MIDARRRDSTTKRDRVRDALRRMQDDGTPITFAQVAAHARVSSWLVYSPGIRELIQHARAHQPTPTPTHPSATAAASDADTASAAVEDLRTDLALARAEITRLRADRDHHQQQLRLALGARLDNLAKADLAARVDELTRHNNDLAATNTRHDADNRALRTRIIDLEDDLAAARTSLRRMIRAGNLPPADHADIDIAAALTDPATDHPTRSR